MLFGGQKHVSQLNWKSKTFFLRFFVYTQVESRFTAGPVPACQGKKLPKETVDMSVLRFITKQSGIQPHHWHSITDSDSTTAPIASWHICGNTGNSHRDSWQNTGGSFRRDINCRRAPRSPNESRRILLSLLQISWDERRSKGKVWGKKCIRRHFNSRGFWLIFIQFTRSFHIKRKLSMLKYLHWA